MTQHSGLGRLTGTVTGLLLVLGIAGACSSEFEFPAHDAVSSASVTSEPTTGAQYGAVLAEHPDFPKHVDGQVSGDLTSFQWRDRAWVFDREGVLIEVIDEPGAPPLDAPPATDREEKAGQPAPLALPDAPRLEESSPGCTSNVHAWEDIRHPTYGTVRVFLGTAPGAASQTGCIIASAPGGETVYLAKVQVRGPDQLQFARQVTDTSTGNSFITYDPGRYGGIFVLIPTADGFVAPSGPDPDGFQSDGRVRYYSTGIAGSDSGDPIALLESVNTCEPSCADANYRSALLKWNGYAYVE